MTVDIVFVEHKTASRIHSTPNENQDSQGEFDHGFLVAIDSQSETDGQNDYLRSGTLSSSLLAPSVP